MDKVRVRVRARVRVRVSVIVRVRARVRVRAEWATAESPKHHMAVNVRVYFILKYARYIFHGIFCPV